MKTYGAKWSEHPHYSQDPLPEIEPALLNSLDIKRYVEKECLIELDSFDECRMKPASYELKFLGTLYDWRVKNGRLEKRCREIVDGQEIKLDSNSISYLWIKERLRLPEYIAARFNLRISDVHKGILLGTGPLIDPGFGGRILIPLHNLTDNQYPLTGGEGIIWVEFTKVSKNPHWLTTRETANRPPGLIRFPAHKTIDDPIVYLNKAGAVDGVQSAYKGAFESARRDADDAKKRVKGIQTRVTAIGVATGFGVLVGIAALVFSAYEISGQVEARVHSHGERIVYLERKLEELYMQLNAADPNRLLVEDASAKITNTDEKVPKPGMDTKEEL